MRELGPACTDLFFHAQPGFIRMQACSYVHVSFLQFMHVQVPSCERVQNSTYIGPFLRTHSPRQKP